MSEAAADQASVSAPALLAHFLGQQVLFGSAVDRCGKVGGKLGELGVAFVGAFAIWAQIHPFRLVRKSLGQRQWQRMVRSRRKIAAGFVPG